MNVWSKQLNRDYNSNQNSKHELATSDTKDISEATPANIKHNGDGKRPVTQGISIRKQPQMHSNTNIKSKNIRSASYNHKNDRSHKVISKPGLEKSKNDEILECSPGVIDYSTNMKKQNARHHRQSNKQQSYKLYMSNKDTKSARFSSTSTSNNQMFNKRQSKMSRGGGHKRNVTAKPDTKQDLTEGLSQYYTNEDKNANKPVDQLNVSDESIGSADDRSGNRFDGMAKSSSNKHALKKLYIAYGNKNFSNASKTLAQRIRLNK